MQEIWKPVVGFEDLYEVSSMGRVKSLKRLVWNGKTHYLKEGQMLKSHNSGRDRKWLYSHLSKEGHKKYFLTARLVAEAFIYNPNNYKYVVPKDGNHSNNNVNNLMWCESYYNTMRSIMKGEMKMEKEKSLFETSLSEIIDISSEDKIQVMKNICDLQLMSQKAITMIAEGYDLDEVAGTVGNPQLDW